MITLKEALQVTKIDENEIVRVRRKNQEDEFLTKKNIVNKFDLRNIKVSNISPYFFCGEYEGFMFTLIEPVRKEK